MDKHSAERVPKTETRESKFEKFNDIYYRRFIAGFMILIIFGLGFAAYKINDIRTKGFEVFLGDTSLGYVRDEQMAVSLMNNYNKSLSQKYNADIVFKEDLSFEPTNIKDDSLATITELNRNIKNEASFLVTGYAINIDGEQVGIVKNETQANAILEEIKEPYISNLDEGRKLLDVDIVENVKISSVDIPVDDIGDKEEILELIRTGGEEIKTHTVEVGESFWTIAKMYGMPVEELLKANHGIDEKSLRPGDSVKISVPSSKATVITTEEVKSIENVDYEIIVEKDNSMWEDQRTIKVQGKPGKANVVSTETKHNGSLVERKILSEEIIEEPVNQVVIQGTKERPKTVATGSFRVPTRGRISSRYGMRNGRMHRGLDLAAPTGTPIYAADGGVVTFAGRKGSYGYMVEINHENGYKTRYAHASKIHVKVGTRVYKGQHIANVGNTGRSTGSHLHFEVLVNGAQRNPSSFIY